MVAGRGWTVWRLIRFRREPGVKAEVKLGQRAAQNWATLGFGASRTAGGGIGQECQELHRLLAKCATEPPSIAASAGSRNITRAP